MEGTGNALADQENSNGVDLTQIRMTQPYSATGMFQSVLWSIPTTCENPEKTIQFLNLIYEDPAISALLQFGIEGTSYTVVNKDDNGTVIQFPEGQNAMTVPYYQIFGVFGNRFEWPVMVPGTTTSNKELLAYSQSITRKSPALGYCFAPDNVSTEYAAVQAVIQQNANIIATGAVDPKEFLPDFINQLKAAGIDAVVAENQKQLDAWLAGEK